MEHALYVAHVTVLRRMTLVNTLMAQGDQGLVHLKRQYLDYKLV